MPVLWPGRLFRWSEWFCGLAFLSNCDTRPNHGPTGCPLLPSTLMVNRDTTVLLTADEVRARVAELASEIRYDSGVRVNGELHLLSVLKGGFIFLADLARALELPVTVDFIALESYGGGTESAGAVRVRHDFEMSVHGRDVLVVEDIVDTGRTLAWLHRHVRAGQPRSLRTVALLDKPSRRMVPVNVEHVGFTIADQFVVGYGLDHGERFRNMPHIAVLNLPVAGPGDTANRKQPAGGPD